MHHYNMVAPSLFVIVPGFGSPFKEHKLQILENNLRVIRAYPWSKVKVRVCCYDPNVASIIPEDMYDDDSIEWVFRKGIVGQFIGDLAPPETTQNYDFVLIILDDIELKPNVNFATIMRYHKMFRFDIYSPTLTSTSMYQYKYMLEEPQGAFAIKVSCACEAFCYFMPSESYARYHKVIEPNDNPWLWGEDLCLLKYNHLRVAILNKMQMHHYYKNQSYHLRPDKLPEEGYNSVVRKYDTTPDELANQKAIIYVIFDTFG